MGERAVARHPDTAWLDEGDRIVVAPLPGGPIRFLVGPAAAVWRLCPEPVAVTDLCRRVVSAYPDAPAGAEASVRAVVDGLIGTRLLAEPVRP